MLVAAGLTARIARPREPFGQASGSTVRSPTAPRARKDRRSSDRGSDRRPPAVFAPEIQNRKGFRTAENPRVRAAALRTDLALRGRNLRSTAALWAPLCLNRTLLHNGNPHHIESRSRVVCHFAHVSPRIPELMMQPRPFRSGGWSRDTPAPEVKTTRHGLQIPCPLGRLGPLRS